MTSEDIAVTVMVVVIVVALGGIWIAGGVVGRNRK